MALLWIMAAQRRDSVSNLLSYQPTDGNTWDEVHELHDWDHPVRRDFVEDIRRNGVRKPVMVDYENDPPTVEDGHTRILAAHKAGISDVPVKQGTRADFYAEQEL